MFAFAVATLPIAVRADEARLITSAIDAFYLNNIYTSLHWTNICIIEDGRYATFSADNEETSITTLLKRSHESWNVALPGKGIPNPDLYGSADVPLDVAGILLAGPALQPGSCSKGENAAARLLATRVAPGDQTFFGVQKTIPLESGHYAVAATSQSFRLPAMMIHTVDHFDQRSHTQRVPAVVGTIRLVQTSALLSTALVANICIPPGVDYTVDRWSFVSPYLLCFVGDAKSGTGELLRRTSAGSYLQVSHGGGDIPLAGLKAYGVPPPIASRLLATLHD